jgi:hypothetical protein
MPLTLNKRKPQNRAPLLPDLGGESQGKEPRHVHTYIPHQIPKRKVSKPPQENRQDKAPKITKKGETGETQLSLEEPHRIIYTYHEDSYKVLLASRSSIPLSRSHHEALKLVLKNPKENRKGK